MTGEAATLGNKICCPVDFSDCSRGAMLTAAALAAELGGEVVLLHVFQAPVYTLADGAVTTSPELMQQISDSVDKSLAAWAAEATAASHVKVSTASAIGNPAISITDFADGQRCDLIVMGSHGRTGIKHFLLGSVAERVLRRASCPVMVLPRTTQPPGRPTHTQVG